MSQDQGWHLDKRVPISIIGVLVLQIMGGVWLASEMRGDIGRNASDIARLDRQVELAASASQTQAVQLGRIEENLSGMRGDINRLIRALEAQR